MLNSGFPQGLKGNLESSVDLEQRVSDMGGVFLSKSPQSTHLLLQSHVWFREEPAGHEN